MKAFKKVAQVAMAPFYGTVVAATGLEEIVFKSVGYVTGNETIKLVGDFAQGMRESALDLMMGKEMF